MKKSSLAALGLAALGVVYGDIGTSPLYAFEQVFSNGTHSVPISEINVLGILSLFFWSLMFVVTLKYVLFIMRADNNGEGGIMALMALALRKSDLKKEKVFQWTLLILGILGASFFYGDGVITPAISVLSAVEGLELISPSLKDWVLPVSIGILLVLFWSQKKGTGKIGLFFGPVMAIWFVSIGLLGIPHIMAHPEVLKAVNPYYAIQFLMTHGALSFFALGAVVLCLTGAEALYADMGHFGAKPIRIVWLNLVLPCLLLNYLGQGALLLSHPDVLNNLFYSMASPLLQTPLIVLATMATVIASQAVISGTFSMTRQAIQLGYLPSIKTLQTSAEEVGQIFIPVINGFLMIGVVTVILMFKSSNALGSAYGIAVTGTMLITDFLAMAMVVRVWGWSKIRALAGAIAFILVDLVFFGSNTLKIIDGGWLPLLISFGIIIIMTTWYQGKQALIRGLKAQTFPLQNFLDKEVSDETIRLEGVGVYLTSDNTLTPIALVRTYKHFNGIHKHILVLSLDRAWVPYVKEEDRITVSLCGKGFSRVNINVGFMEKISIPHILTTCAKERYNFDLEQVSYFINRQVIIVKNNKRMLIWRKILFKFLYRNAQQPLEFFDLPAADVLMISTQVEI